MSFNYLTNSGEFTRIAACVGRLFDSAVDEHIEKLSRRLRPDPASPCLNRPCDLPRIAASRAASGAQT
jgi:hypothetical protein